MKSIGLLSLALTLVVGLVVAPVAAEETTISGSIMCAKCALKKADARECQDVLVAKNASGDTMEYYVTKNDVSKAFGHTCQGEVKAKVTGAVATQDGKQWITPSKMEKQG